MSTKSSLTAEIEAFLDRVGMSPTRFGVLTVNDAKLVSRLRAGSDVRTQTADKLREFMREYRPSQKNGHSVHAA